MNHCNLSVDFKLCVIIKLNCSNIYWIRNKVMLFGNLNTSCQWPLFTISLRWQKRTPPTTIYPHNHSIILFQVYLPEILLWSTGTISIQTNILYRIFLSGNLWRNSLMCSLTCFISRNSKETPIEREIRLAREREEELRREKRLPLLISQPSPPTGKQEVCVCVIRL